MNPLLLEIGTEEIPAGYIQPALDALASNLTRKLGRARIDHGAVQTYGTPRRLVVRLDDVAQRQQSVTEEVLGPPERIAFDENGKPTVPAQKFSEKVGVPMGKLKVAETDKGRYLCATISDKGLATKTVLKEILPEVILDTPFPKTMRWSALSISFARPIQSIMALLGKSVISFALEEKIKSGRYAWGHMFMQHRKIKIDHVNEYEDKMRQARVIVDIEERKEMVRKEVASAAKAMGGRVLPDEELLDVVTNLVEIPIATGGRFDDVFLELPKEILITSMREHQKYFAVVDDNDQLMPCFVAVNNTRTKDLDLVARGHERVLRARLSDAQFFYRADLQNKMDDWREQLKGVLFQAKLGSMHAKVERVEQLGAHLTRAESSGNQAQVKRAAQLCKADLVSQVVGEFAKLQGIMGRVYASVAKEPGDVATAIEEHYRPIYSGGALPETRTGAYLAIADKLDTICGCFSVGLIPTGASDPYALRRQGIGIVQIILKHQLPLSLKDAIGAGLKPYDAGQNSSTADQIYTFILNRVSRMLVEEGYDKDVVAAVATVSIDDIPDVWKRTRALQALKGAADFEPLAAGFKRVVNILRKAQAAADIQPDAALFDEPTEKSLYAAYQAAQSEVGQLLDNGDLESALRVIAKLREPVDRFFEDVMVMTDDMGVRKNRLALLNAIAGLFNRMADFSKIAV
ncbi:MAG: glycine--tRNA ligase subunit beta [Desulfobacteraceae bacterium]